MGLGAGKVRGLNLSILDGSVILIKEPLFVARVDN